VLSPEDEALANRLLKKELSRIREGEAQIREKKARIREMKGQIQDLKVDIRCQQARHKPLLKQAMDVVDDLDPDDPERDSLVDLIDRYLTSED
jgi:hypothetical protein